LENSNVQMLPDVTTLLDKPLPAGPIYVHFDADVLNPDDAPAMSYLAAGGPSAVVLRRVFRRLAQSGQVAGVSVSAWNPNLDEDGRSRIVVMDLLQELIAE
jgi:arginase